MQRLKPLLSFDDIYIITSSDYFHDVASDVKEIAKENILVEPSSKNTAPAIALGLKWLLERGVNENEEIVVLPADHIVHPIEDFCAYLLQAHPFVQSGALVTFGVPPSRPETGFGYIKAHQSHVEAFVEKPDLQTAQQYLMSGNYFWNTGIFAFSLQTMLNEMQKHCPEIDVSGNFDAFSKHFSTLPAISIDYAVMEKSKNINMIAMHLTWSDVGSWDNVYEMMDKDEKENVIVGDVTTLNTGHSLIFAESRRLCTIGMEGVLIIETKDAVLVAKRNEGQKVKEMVEKLALIGAKEVETHLTTQRPWGFYSILEEGKRYKIKRIHVDPQAKLSLQLHYHRSEHWVVVTGTAKVTINAKETIVHEGESIFVPKSSMHRVENPGKVPLEIIEVQVGEYLGEDDIIRLEDVYGRLKQDAAFAILELTKKI